jgi:AcrR family transcriptional regulator
MRSDEARTMRRSRADSTANTRKRLLDAARGVFTTTGYQGATLDDIAARAGFTKGAVYWHFPNKQAIFMALVADAMDANLRLLEVLAPDQGTPAEVKKRLADWIDGIDERETLPQFGVELEIEARRDPSFRAIHQGMIAKHEAAIADYLTRYFAKVSETPVMPIPELASALITIFKGFSLSRQNRPDAPVNSSKVARLLMGMPIA